MPVDWGATGDMLSGIGAISGAVAVGVAAWLGSDALRNFREQKISERQIEHAERTLAITYKLEDALKSLRSPMSTAHELTESEKQLQTQDGFKSMPESELKRFVQANVYYLRIRQSQTTFDEAFEALPYARAYFDREVEQSLRKLVQCRRTVQVYADAYARDRGVDAALDKKISETLWEGYGDDPMTREIEGAIARTEDRLLKVIRMTTSKALANKGSIDA